MFNIYYILDYMYSLIPGDILIISLSSLSSSSFSIKQEILHFMESRSNNGNVLLFTLHPSCPTVELYFLWFPGNNNQFPTAMERGIECLTKAQCMGDEEDPDTKCSLYLAALEAFGIAYGADTDEVERSEALKCRAVASFDLGYAYVYSKPPRGTSVKNGLGHFFDAFLDVMKALRLGEASKDDEWKNRLNIMLVDSLDEYDDMLLHRLESKEDAEEFYEKVLNLEDEVLDDEAGAILTEGKWLFHMRLVNILYGRAMALVTEGDYKSALELLEGALEHLESLPEDYVPELVSKLRETVNDEILFNRTKALEIEEIEELSEVEDEGEIFFAL